MEPHKTRAAVAFAALTAELYHAAREDIPPGALNPFVLLAGPELRRRPWLKHYVDPTVLRETHEAMKGREELYKQMHDLLALLGLMFNPITPEQQRAVSQMLVQEYGLWIPDTSIVQMAEHEVWAAIMRLTSFVAAKAPEHELVRYFAWHVPLVLRTAYEKHSVQDASGKTVRIQPMKLAPENLVWWFKQRLLLAVKTRLKRYPDNPLWVLPNGVYRDVRTPTPQEWSDFGKLLQAVYSPVRPGRPKGSGFHHDAKDFLSKVLPVMCDLIRKGRQPTQENVAPYLNTTDRQIREWVKGFHLVWDDLRQRAKETRQNNFAISPISVV